VKVTEGTYIRFVEASGIDPGKKTLAWDVVGTDGAFLGEIKWFGRWRKYSFFPAENCIFEWICLREIAQFSEDRTAMLRRSWHSRRLAEAAQ
jgi:hypothetical protein